MSDQLNISSPNLDNLILECISDTRIDSSLLPDQMQQKVLKLIEGRIDVSKFSYPEKIFLLSTMGIYTYSLTIRQDKDLGIRVVKDLIGSLKNNFTHRQISALKKLNKIDMVVLSDKDVVKYMESVYYIQNKRSIMAMAKDMSVMKTSRLNSQYELKQKEQKAIDDAIKFVANAKLCETKILIDAKFNKSQYTCMMRLYVDGSVLLSELFKIMEGSQKKKYADIRVLEERNLLKFEKIENRKTITAIITSPGRLIIFNLVKKYL